VPLQADDARLLKREEAALLKLDLELETELDDELFTELDVFNELELDNKLEEELFIELEILVATELLFGELEHTAPVIIGFSIEPPLASPWTPKLTDCPGWIVLFQSSAVAL